MSAKYLSEVRSNTPRIRIDLFMQIPAPRSASIPREEDMHLASLSPGGWDLHEEVDADSGGVEGLEGDYDLYGAIGLFGHSQPAGSKQDSKSTPPNRPIAP
jgi:hypothetical protein